MSERRLARHCLALALIALLSMSAGCNWTLLATNVASFAFGADAASHFTSVTTEYQCFRNGVQIDCGSLPPVAGS